MAKNEIAKLDPNDPLVKATASRLAFQLARYPGTWKNFKQRVQMTGSLIERSVVKTCPEEIYNEGATYQHQAQMRQQEALERTASVLLEELAITALEATKKTQTGQNVPDYSARIAASKEILNRTYGQSTAKTEATDPKADRNKSPMERLLAEQSEISEVLLTKKANGDEQVRVSLDRRAGGEAGSHPPPDLDGGVQDSS